MPSLPTSISVPSTAASGRPASLSELAILNHPDRRTSWIVVMTATLRQPAADLAERIAARLPSLSEVAPVLRARWDRNGWQRGDPPEPMVVDVDPVQASQLLAPFDLAHEPPARFVVGRDGRRLALAAHHAALDGRSMLALIAAVLGRPLPAPAAPRVPAGEAVGGMSRVGLWATLGRVFAPADRVVGSAVPVARESFAVREISLRPPNITGQIAQACVDAAGAHNHARGARWQRIGVTVAVGGPARIGNLASYRRLDLRAGEDVTGAVHQALRIAAQPRELAGAPRGLRLLAPVADRFSDSLLVSNLGYAPLPELSQLCLFPVARGRSALAVGASSVRRGETAVALRARDLTPADTESLLDEIICRLRQRI